LTNEQIVAELGWTRKAIKDVTGVTPILFRPPYGDIDDRVRAIAKAMNLVPTIWTSIPDANGDGDVEQWDSNDWRVHAGTLKPVDNQKNFYATLDKSQNLTTGVIVLQHDIYPETVDIAIGNTIPDALARNPPFKMESVQVCQGDPIGNAYVETTADKLPSTGNQNASSGNNNQSTGGTGNSSTRTSTATGTSSSAPSTGGAPQLGINFMTPLVTLGALVLGSLMP
jgi:Polysaccharide deacetylase